MRRFWSKRGYRRTLMCAGVLLLALFFIRPTVGRLRWRVAESISQVIGRRVQVGSVQVRFLPQLGFSINDLVIYDDSSFGAEPMLRAPSVAASLRATSLIRGRIEISNLSLNDASVNLTRDSAGNWNLQDLVERTSRISTAPTAPRRTQGRPAFPYIEASHARINFKIGAEKTHFALTDAQFALWQETDNSWGVRLKAQPIRTDANLTDTGVINISGSWQRHPEPSEMPITVAFQWKQAQVGQVSKLIFGADKGWRGGLLVSGNLVGTPAKLKLTADTSVDDLRRDNVIEGDDLPVSAHCHAIYNYKTNSLADVDCAAPAGTGSLELTGSASSLSSYRFSVAANSIPAAVALGFARHSSTALPPGLILDGVLNSALSVEQEDSQSPRWSGDGEIQDLKIGADNTPTQLRIAEVPFSIGTNSEDASDLSRIEVGPFSTSLGRPAPLVVRASISYSGYEAEARGEASVRRLLQMAQTLGIPAQTFAADGAAAVDLSIAGNWIASLRPAVIGTAQLRNVRAQIRGLNSPIEIRNANLVLSRDAVRVQNLVAGAANAQWRGSIVVPRPCSAPADCKLQFNLHSAEVNAAAVNGLLNPAARKQAWYRFLGLDRTPVPYLLQARASGRVTIDRLLLGPSAASQLSGDISLDRGKLTLSNLRMGILGGELAGDWEANFTAKPPTYEGSGNLEEVSLSQVADLMHDSWIGGTSSLKYDFTTAGWDLQNMLASADLNADFVVQDATFPHIVLNTKSGSLRSNQFSGDLLLSDGKISLQNAKLATSNGLYNVSGTASLSGTLNMKMVGESASGYDVSGTFNRTRVSQLVSASTRAALNP